MRNLIFRLIVFTLIPVIACTSAPETAEIPESTDGLCQLWIDAWNARDAVAIEACFANDALLITDTVYSGIDAIRSGFIERATPYFKNLTCSKLYESISGSMAYPAGKYDHEWIVNDSTVTKASGYYTMVWKKSDDNTWKLAVFQTN